VIGWLRGWVSEVVVVVVVVVVDYSVSWPSCMWRDGRPKGD
jgi:hypothetical protein